LSNASHAPHGLRSCGQKPPCCGGALCGQRREERLDVRELPRCTFLEVTSCMLSALICTRAFRTVRQSLAQDRYGSLPDSLKFTRLSHSETVCDTAWAGPDPSHPPYSHAVPVCVGAREVLGRQIQGGMKLAAREGKVPMWGGARHAFCRAVGRTRCLNTRGGPTGRRHRERKEPDDATQRCHDA
jgi:hypothetical protein